MWSWACVRRICEHEPLSRRTCARMSHTRRTVITQRVSMDLECTLTTESQLSLTAGHRKPSEAGKMTGINRIYITESSSRSSSRVGLQHDRSFKGKTYSERRTLQRVHLLAYRPSQRDIRHRNTRVDTPEVRADTPETRADTSEAEPTHQARVVGVRQRLEWSGYVRGPRADTSESESTRQARASSRHTRPQADTPGPNGYVGGPSRASA